MFDEELSDFCPLLLFLDLLVFEDLSPPVDLIELSDFDLLLDLEVAAEI